MKCNTENAFYPTVVYKSLPAARRRTKQIFYGFFVQLNSRIELSNSSNKEVENRVGVCVIAMETKLNGRLFPAAYANAFPFFKKDSGISNCDYCIGFLRPHSMISQSWFRNMFVANRRIETKWPAFRRQHSKSFSYRETVAFDYFLLKLFPCKLFNQPQSSNTISGIMTPAIRQTLHVKV